MSIKSQQNTCWENNGNNEYVCIDFKGLKNTEDEE